MIHARMSGRRRAGESQLAAVVAGLRLGNSREFSTCRALDDDDDDDELPHCSHAIEDHTWRLLASCGMCKLSICVCVCVCVCKTVYIGLHLLRVHLI